MNQFPPPYQPAPHPAVPPRRRLGLIVLLVVGALAIAVLLCGGVGTAVYLATRQARNTTAAPVVTPSATDHTQPSTARDGSCEWIKATGTNVKDIGTPPPKPPTTGSVTMRLVTNLGTISVAIDLSKTPCTAASFVYLSEKHFFDGTSCHRLVTSGIFVLQCGDPSGTGTGGPGYSFGDENLGATAGTYPRGMVAMANAGPSTNGSQFFIVYKNSPLPASYTPFGTVTDGLSVVDQVAAGGDDGANGQSGDGHPKIPVTMRTVTVS